MLDTLLEKANNLPMKPGVYIMLDSSGEVIYVGKAKKLKNRVTSYFRGSHLPKVAAMVEKAFGVHVLAVRTINVKGGLRYIRGTRRAVQEATYKKAIVTVKAGERIEQV